MFPVPESWFVYYLAAHWSACFLAKRDDIRSDWLSLQNFRFGSEHKESFGKAGLIESENVYKILLTELSLSRAFCFQNAAASNIVMF